MNYDNTNLYLGVAQAFFVKVESGVSSLDFTGDMRVLGSSDDDNFFRTEDQKSIIKLSATSTYGVSTTIIGLTSDASAGYDSKYDAPALLGNAKTAIFSKMNGERYAIQGLALDATEVEIEVSTTEETTIALADYINGAQSVALVDMESGKVTDLKTETYTFEPTVSGKKSFKIVIGGEAASVLASSLANAQIKLQLSEKGIQIIGDKKFYEVSVLDISGRVLFSGNSSGMVNMPLSYNKIYIVNVNGRTSKFSLTK